MFSKEFAYLLITCRKWKQKERWYGKSVNWFSLNADTVFQSVHLPADDDQVSAITIEGMKETVDGAVLVFTACRHVHLPPSDEQVVIWLYERKHSADGKTFNHNLSS